MLCHNTRQSPSKNSHKCTLSDQRWHLWQVAEAKEAGAAGIIGVIANVLGNGSPIMSSFAAAIGLDAPVEVCRTHIACMPHSASLVSYKADRDLTMGSVEIEERFATLLLAMADGSAGCSTWIMFCCYTSCLG
jgi:hypothetical protein